MMISSPASTSAISCDNVVLALWMVTDFMGTRRRESRCTLRWQRDQSHARRPRIVHPILANQLANLQGFYPPSDSRHADARSSEDVVWREQVVDVRDISIEHVVIPL